MNYTVNFNALNKTPKFLIVSYLKGMILKWLQLFQGNVFYCLPLIVSSHNGLLYWKLNSSKITELTAVKIAASMDKMYFWNQNTFLRSCLDLYKQPKITIKTPAHCPIGNVRGFWRLDINLHGQIMPFWRFYAVSMGFIEGLRLIKSNGEWQNSYLRGFLIAACAAANLAIGTRKGEHDT